MTEKIVPLFAEVGAVHQFEKPELLLARLSVDAKVKGANKALVILIDDRSGSWSTNWEAAGMTNSEVKMALDIVNHLVMSAVMGEN